MPAVRQIVAFASFSAVVSIAGPSAAGDLQGYGGVSVDLELPRGPLASKLPSAFPGVQLAFGVGHRDLPLTLGMRVGIAGFLEHDQPGPTLPADPARGYSAQTVVNTGSLLQRYEAVVRVAPPIHLVRPFAEASVGLVSVSTSYELHHAGGPVIVSSDDSLKTSAPTYGFALGVAFEPLRRQEKHPDDGGRSTTSGLAFTAGIRYQRTGALDLVDATSDGGFRWTTVSSAFAFWMPFVGIEVVAN